MKKWLAVLCLVALPWLGGCSFARTTATDTLSGDSGGTTSYDFTTALGDGKSALYTCRSSSSGTCYFLLAHEGELPIQHAVPVGATERFDLASPLLMTCAMHREASAMAASIRDDKRYPCGMPVRRITYRYGVPVVDAQVPAP